MKPEEGGNAMPTWNPWHGCIKLGSGCNHCYVYRRDAEFGKDASKIKKTAKFDLPVQKNRRGAYKLLPEEEPVYVCMSSDFFLKAADEWRKDAWAMMRERADLSFVIVTKRIHRFKVSLPEDWGEGYENVTVMCSAENQSRADDRIPELLSLPIRHKAVLLEPMLERIQMEAYLKSGQIERVVCGGETGEDARVCDFAWVLDAMNQCVKYDVPFQFKQTGTFFKKGEKVYHIEEENQKQQAKRAGVDFGQASEKTAGEKES